MKYVVSASRRTDMPSRYLDRLVTYVEQGYADVRNPFSGKITTVDLDPGRVHTLVLWSKNFAPFLKNSHPFRRYHLYFLFTVNDMPVLEPAIPPLAERLDQAEELARRYGARHIGWRYDPIVFRSDGPVSTIESFRRIGERMAGIGVDRAIFSFLDFYGKVKARNSALGLNLVDPPEEVKTTYAGYLAGIAAGLGMSLFSCCEPLGNIDGVTPSSCIDGRLLAELGGEPVSTAKDTGQRRECNCAVSRDIGSYRDMPCGNGCLYCYANPVIRRDM